MRSWARLSDDGSRVFVMISTEIDSYEAENPEVIRLPAGRTGNVRDLFPRSGLYDARSLALIQPITWFEQPYDIQLSHDASVIAQRNRFALGTGPALVFHRGGKVFRKYEISELLTFLADDSAFPYESWDWHSRWYDRFDVEGDQLVLTTASRRVYVAGTSIDSGLQERYVFSFDTGEIVQRRVLGLWRIGGYLLALVSVVGFGIVGVRLGFHRYRRRRDSRTRGFPIYPSAPVTSAPEIGEPDKSPA